MSDLFYVFGGALTVVALVLSLAGLRFKGYPSSGRSLAAGLALMVALVIGSCAFAVALAREEADHREHEQAEAAEEAATEGAEGTEGGDTGPPTEAEEPIETEPAEGETLELTSPEDGALMFDTDTLEAAAGQVEIAYTNPSPVPHDVAIEEGGETLAQGEAVTTGDTTTAAASLEPGEYVFYCSIPGHREAGMEGALTVTP